MLLAEFVREFSRTGFQHLGLELVSLGHQSIEDSLRLAHQSRSDAQLAQARPGEMEFVIAKQPFEDRQQPARASFFRRRSFCQQTQRFVLETDLDAVRAKRALRTDGGVSSERTQGGAIGSRA